MNPHTPTFVHSPEGVTYKAICVAPDCGFVLYAGGGTDETYAKLFFREHAIQYEPGHAPDIAVDWEISAECSVCGDGGHVEVVDSETIRCVDCGTAWTIDGRDGERAEVDA